MDVVRTAIEQIRRQGLVPEQSRNRHQGPARSADSYRDVPDHGGRGRWTVVRHCHGSGVRDGAGSARPGEHDEEDNDGFVLRDRVVPIISLAALIDLPERKRDAATAKTSDRHGSGWQDSRH